MFNLFTYFPVENTLLRRPSASQNTFEAASAERRQKTVEKVFRFRQMAGRRLVTSVYTSPQIDGRTGGGDGGRERRAAARGRRERKSRVVGGIDEKGKEGEETEGSGRK